MGAGRSFYELFEVSGGRGLGLTVLQEATYSRALGELPQHFYPSYILSGNVEGFIR